MKSRISFLLVPVTAVLGVGTLVAACSSSVTSTTAAADAATDGVADSGVIVTDSSKGGSSVDSPPDPDCVLACQKAHPSGYALDKKIDECWITNCKAECVDAAPPDASAKEAGVDAGTCKTPPDTGDAICDRCTNDNCCAAWDGCFDNQDCDDYETCYAACP